MVINYFTTMSSTKAECPQIQGYKRQYIFMRVLQSLYYKRSLMGEMSVRIIVNVRHEIGLFRGV